MVVLPLSGCGSARNAEPVTVATPGLPSPERALQQSLDRVHAFMASLNERLETPARLSVPMQHTTDAMIVSTAPSAQKTPIPTSSPPPQASPLTGKGGVTWFGFGDGTPTINCRYPDICIVRLEQGETALQTDLRIDDMSNWHADLVRGDKGIHSGWAIALDPGAQATQTTLELKSSRRIYRLALSSSGASMRSVAFTHTPGEPLSQPEIVHTVGKTGTPDFTYHMSGKASWAPLRAYREAGRTYIQFPPGGINAAPRLVIISPQSTHTQAYQTIGDSYVVDLPVDKAMLIGHEPGSPTILITHGETK